MVGREGEHRLVANDEVTQGITYSMPDISCFFGDILLPDCKLFRCQEHRDTLFTPQPTPGSPAHQALLAEATNYGSLLPPETGCVPHGVLGVVAAAGGQLERGECAPGSGRHATWHRHSQGDRGI